MDQMIREKTMREESWKKDWKEGWKEGWIEGWIEGWKEGWREGIEMEKKATAKRAISLNLSIEQIEKLTGLSAEQIKELTNQEAF